MITQLILVQFLIHFMRLESLVELNQILIQTVCIEHNIIAMKYINIKIKFHMIPSFQLHDTVLESKCYWKLHAWVH